MNSELFYAGTFFYHEDEFGIAFTTNGDTEFYFRTNEEAIIPYIKTNFEDTDLKEVVIGPKNNSDLAKIGIQTYLKKLGYDLSNVSVEKSSIPLRF
ncbi:hypothetical protein NSQ43_07295 [Sporosarcina sp. FSL W8-0480]|uniref:hypothetical protein n=1 Tax=Sporosarcina sp. FSL W8-0480 TaxID=2954701 RepID=UPI0030DDDA42